MIQSEEVELKLELDPGEVERFRSLPLLGAPARPASLQVSTYFDTPEADLRQAGYSLRLRRKGERCIQTVKRNGGETGGFSIRDEWEQPVEGPGLDFAVFDGTPAGKLLSKKARARLRTVSETRVERTTWLIGEGDGAIELILDEGAVAGGGRSEPICEIELELKAGERRRLFELACQIGRETPLRMGVLSKSERGALLAEGRSGRVRKAEPVAIGRDADVAAAFAAVVQSCLRHFRQNEPLAVERGNRRAVHQMRVAIRRLRSAFSLFKPALAGAERDRILSELRWLGDLLGRARDLDVVLAARPGSGEPGAGAAEATERKRLRAERASAYEALRSGLAGPRVPALILGLVAWAETGAWRDTERARRPIPGFADERLDRRWRAVRKGGKDIAALAPEERHRLRIETKRLRYAGEFMAALAPKGRKRRRKAFGAALEALQEALGRLNDVETARRLAPDLTPATDPDILLAEAQAAHDRLRALGPYWR